MEQLLIPYEAVATLGHGSVLVLAPHPDDEAFGCGGAILAHVAAGDPVRVIVITDGSHGAEGEEAINANRQIREEESRRAANLLGYGEPVFWCLPDRGVEHGEPLVERIAGAIVESKADLVYAPSILEIHPDHRALAMSAAEAVRRCEHHVQLIMYEVGIPLRPNRLLDITPWADRKQEAMGCFKTQLCKQPYDQHIAALNRFRTYTLPAHISTAEAFYVVTGKQLQANPLCVYGPDYARQELRTHDGDQPLVSVIIRSIDRPQLQEVLQSVALQTYRNIEIVVVNAKGSEHAPIVDRCGRFPIRVCGGIEPLPRSRAANLGLDNATGDYLIFLDDDDIFFPDHIAGLVQALQGDPQAKAAYAGIREETYRKDGSPGPVLIRNGAFDLHKLCAENFLPIHAVLFHRSVLDQGIKFDESLRFYEDWDFWVQIAMCGRFVHVEKVSACYKNFGACGFGLDPDRELVSSARAAFFEKWKQHWSGEQLRNIIDAAKDTSGADKIRIELEEAGRQLRETREQLEEIRSSSTWAIVSKCSRIRRQLKSLARLFRKGSPDKARMSREISNS